jgi:hypothetical protein
MHSIAPALHLSGAAASGSLATHKMVSGSEASRPDPACEFPLWPHNVFLNTTPGLAR